MSTRTHSHISMKLICRSLIVLLLILTAPMASADTVEVITSQDIAAADLTRPSLRSIFTMRLREWPNGTPVRVFVLPDNNPIHDQFCREQLGIYPYVLRGIWDKRVFAGTGFAPSVVNSEQEMREKVRSTPGAIGYISRDVRSASYSIQLSFRMGNEGAR